MSSTRLAWFAAVTAALAAGPVSCTCGEPPASLVFSAQPTRTVAGQVMAPAVQVTAQDAKGQTAGSYAGTVTLAIATGPMSGTLAGTATVNAVNGVATFSDLSFNKIGSYTLSASAANLPAATSAPFDIDPGAGTRLTYLQEPIDVSINRAFTPAVQVGILDQFQNLTRSTATVQVQLTANPGSGTLSGTRTVAAVDGTATFSDLSINLIGNGYRLGATSSGLVAAESAAFSVTAPRLAYTNPTRTAKVRLVRDDAASTDTSIVLTLEAAAPITGYSIGLNLPLDPAKVVAPAQLITPGFAFPAGSLPSTPVVAAKIVTTGPLAGVLVSGQSQRPTGTGANAGDSSVVASAVFYSLRLNMTPVPNFGLVFDGNALGPKFRASVRDRQGNEVVPAGEFAIGRLEVR